MVDLACSDGAAWKQQLERYPSLIEALSKPKLQELDLFYTCSLPELLRSRQPSPFITKDELAKVVQWKLSRGKWRPKLLSYATSLDEEEVKNTSKTSFSALPDLKAAINALSALKGIGPATASAALAAVAPEVAPFMSDEAMIAVLGNVKDYTLKQYLLFAEKLQSKAEELSQSSAQAFTPSDLERALWCVAIEKKLPRPVVKEDKGDGKGNEISTKESNRKRRKKS